MKVVNGPDHRLIADRWKAQYCKGGAWRACKSGIDGAKRIHAELLMLGSDPQPEDIERIIGNDTWTR